ncbi:hypothetical protein ACIBL3_41865 [Kribbella sp. NPDC050124]|uniref:hypothetical protein n=1 Tax=Kribbella sp. NPDC050124 TaxID=3364114 RepID=UPI0037A835D1
MSGRPTYELLLTHKFVDDLRRLAADARRDPTQVFLRQQVLRQIEQLSTGATDGHHALGYEPGKGDLRDCVVGYVQSDPERKADYRLVFREIASAESGDLPRRELLAVRPRHGPNNIYAHTGARLDRHPSDRHPGLNRFGDRPANSGGSEAIRQAELDTKRAIAHAWTGQQPLTSSRPLTLVNAPPHALTTPPTRHPSTIRPTFHTPPGPRPPRTRPAPTGWPTHTTGR